MTTATTLAAEVRSGERSAREVVDAALAAVDSGDGAYHAFLCLLADEARAEADAVDAAVAAGRDPGPLAGVPVALKDNLCTRGALTTCGSKILENWHPPYDATVVQALRRAGGIGLGKTKMDGSAASVAAGFTPLALGSDTGGSIRQPAALCGVVGMKPTYGRVSRYGLVAFASSLDQIGPFATTVEDAALLFDVLAGHDPLDSTSLPSAAEPTLPTAHQGGGGMRGGLCRALVDGCAPDVVARVREAADALAGAGAKVEEVSVPEFGYGLSAYYLIAPAEASSNLARSDRVTFGMLVDVDGEDVAAMNTATRTAGFGAEVKRRIMLGTYALSAGYYDAYYAQAQRVRTLVMQAFDTAYSSYDVLLGATAPTTAFDVGAKVDDPMAMYMNDVCTIPSNLSGHPAVSVPFGVGADGLPVGVQVLAPALQEALLFRVAQVVENGGAGTAPPGTPWRRPRRP